MQDRDGNQGRPQARVMAVDGHSLGCAGGTRLLQGHVLKYPVHIAELGREGERVTKHWWGSMLAVVQFAG